MGMRECFNSKVEMKAQRTRGIGQNMQQYPGIPDATHKKMIEYGQWATAQMKGDRTGLEVVIGKWTGEKKGGYADRVKV